MLPNSRTASASVRALKGESRPVNPLDDRLAVLAALECVDAVTSFAESTPAEIVPYLANGLVQRLNYIRPHAFELDGIDGTYAQLLTSPQGRKVLIVIDSFRYGRNGPLLAQAAKEQGTEVVVFCDELCDWASAITPCVVALPMEPDLFLWPSTALHFSLNLLVQDVIDELGDSVTAHLKKLSKAQDTFGQYSK